MIVHQSFVLQVLCCPRHSKLEVGLFLTDRRGRIECADFGHGLALTEHKLLFEIEFGQVEILY